MSNYYTSELMVNNHYENHEEAIADFQDLVNNLDCFENLEITEQKIAYVNFIDEYKDHRLMYCFGADHYFIDHPELPEQ